MVYAGIGSRETPQEICEMMQSIGFNLGLLGFVLRSGGADRADSAFEFGCDEAGGPKQIFRTDDTTAVSMELASKHHPAWDRCSPYARALLGRNPFQILGRDLMSPVDFVATWTPGGRIQGGTAIAIRIANEKHIEVYNLADPHSLDAITEIMGG